jgi:hypothetical protein
MLQGRILQKLQILHGYRLTRTNERNDTPRLLSTFQYEREFLALSYLSSRELSEKVQGSIVEEMFTT